MVKLLILLSIISKTFVSGFSLSMSNISSTRTTSLLSINKHTNSIYNPPHPFTNDYGVYCLTDIGHSYQDYFSNINIDYDASNEYFVVEAPYLVYVNEENRYVNDEVVNTLTGEPTSEHTYDLWDPLYNTQPYVTSTTPFTISGYWGDTFIRTLSYTLSGNSFDANNYYLQNLRIYISPLTNDVNNIRVTINDYSFSSGVNYVTIQETRNYHQTERSYQEIQTKVYKGGLSRNQTFSISITFSYTYGYTLQSLTKSSSLTCRWNAENYVRGDTSTTYTVTYKAMAATSNDVTVTFTATIYRPDKYINTTFNITTPNSPIISTSASLGSITMNAHPDWYETYFLDTISCSGRGDNSDKTLVTSHWNNVETYFLNLPNSNKQRILGGEDEELYSMYERYDYVVFYKNYGLNDFLARENAVNRYYSSSPSALTIYSDNTSIIIIIASSSIILISTLSLIFLLKRKRINQGAKYHD